MKEQLRIDDSRKTLIDVPVERLREVWDNALEGMLNPVHV
jgi:hypothetical protein